MVIFTSKSVLRKECKRTMKINTDAFAVLIERNKICFRFEKLCFYTMESEK